MILSHRPEAVLKFSDALLPGQIEYWARIGRLAEENPDIPFPFILDILKGKEQIKAGLGTPYIFGEGE